MIHQCKVDGCPKLLEGRTICGAHRARFKRTGRYDLETSRRPNGAGYRTDFGYIVIQSGGVKKYEHIAIAERAFGGRLPPGAHVHHVDGNKSNNDPSNLVICPDAAYHHLLHQRMRALEACGNPGWRSCHYCRKWDDPSRMRASSDRKIYHVECARLNSRKRYDRLYRAKPKTHCGNGHEFTEENTYVHAGKRACKQCRRQYKTAWRARTGKE